MALNSKVRLVGFVGHAGAGKDTAADAISRCVELFDTVFTTSFASALKQGCAQLFNIPLNNFNDPKYKNVIDDRWGVSPRMIAQYVGTELFRDNASKLLPDIGTNFWVKVLELKLNSKVEDNDIVLITDVRFQNEYDWIIENGGVIIIIKRPGSDGNVGLTNHASEAGISNYHNLERTYTLNNIYNLVVFRRQAANLYATIAKNHFNTETET